MKVLFDTNVLLDALLARSTFVADAAFLLTSRGLDVTIIYQ